ncbi:hypothetical protein [Paenibacillus sp. MY03]|uniref:hypothetical protein n=1 Tax=Paenibacillus sp. MY03 TaxID=302980 RepID=UPI00211B2710|nr:hypothetical protein [Paenibacillus sp. MY03]
MSKVGVVGYGQQVKRLLGMMQEMDSDCGISAIADVRHQEIRERMKADGVDMSGISFFENADDMLNGGEFDGIFVGTRGLFVQKATHDFDYINHILGLKHITVCAMTSKQIFKGNKRAGMQCLGLRRDEHMSGKSGQSSETCFRGNAWTLLLLR